ncbi:MAG: helix-turn-helix domain-containing protein [Candidatus Thiodiazotropha endolucinida]
MEPGFNLYSTILLMGAAHGLFLALALLNARGGNVTAHRFLAALTLVFVADLIDSFFLQVNYHAAAIWSSGVSESLNFLYGPLTYFYICVLTKSGVYRLTGKRWLHFLPFAISYLLLLPYFLLDADLKTELLYGDVDIVTPELALVVLGFDIATLASILLIGIYFTLGIRRLHRHSRDIREQFSYTERINLNWMRNLLIGLGVIYVVYLVAIFYSESLGFEDEIINLLMILVVIFIYTMGYLGLHQPTIFSQQNDKQDEEPKVNEADETEIKKYRKSALDSEMTEILLSELKSHMVKKKTYLDNTLTLPQLSRQLDIPHHYLSQVINERLNQNFFDFINRYRVEEAKQQLIHPEQAGKNILAIALDSGFNSKSAFYTAFKKHAGMTPTQFKHS